MTALGRLVSRLREWPPAGTFLAEEVAAAGGEWRDERPGPPMGVGRVRRAGRSPMLTIPRPGQVLAPAPRRAA